MCTVWTYCMCAHGGDARVSPGRCFIFVMKYIKLTYTQARIMFISLLSFRIGGGWRLLRRRAEGGDAAAQLILRFSRLRAAHKTFQTHCKQNLFSSALEGQTGARPHAWAISHLPAGHLSPVSLCSHDKEGLPPHSASPRRRMCCSCAGRSKVRL